ncbi:PfkB family carbohydrate kinase [Plantactinospora sp. BB1]|uniref:PfkB family carbohydrate kinase n=1 Tax=Plantactinospora sp. BB1 TaxID=2071627 RepID=UPI001F294F61|nr:PfkB family carbohydrate kinase [Plantactinospora sp. BB1]
MSAIPQVLVIGQLARDLVLVVDRMPPAGSAADVRYRRELLGGKGANQAVALAQLGARPILLAVAGDDRVGDDLLAQARRDGVDVSQVRRRVGTPTGLIVEALDADGGWRYLQHLPDEMLLTEADVLAATEAFAADAVLVQLQQPPQAALAAARLAREAGRLLVLDGAPADDEHRRPLLAAADVLRADDRETGLLTGVSADDPGQVRAAAEKLLHAGPGLVVLGLGPAGNLFVWADRRWGQGHLLVPLTEERVVDTTGAGDALTAALTVALLRGDPPPDAARYAVAAGGASVGHPGGRPALDGSTLRNRVPGLDPEPGGDPRIGGPA